jgi:hypothetical protein
MCMSGEDMSRKSGFAGADGVCEVCPEEKFGGFIIPHGIASRSYESDCLLRPRRRLRRFTVTVSSAIHVRAPSGTAAALLPHSTGHSALALHSGSQPLSS